MKAKVEKQLCHCKGQHVNCLDCNGTGIIESSPMPIDEGKWYLNIHIPDNALYYKLYPTTHVLCKFCREKLKKTKIVDHVQSKHSDEWKMFDQKNRS